MRLANLRALVSAVLRDYHARADRRTRLRLRRCFLRKHSDDALEATYLLGGAQAIFSLVRTHAIASCPPDLEGPQLPR